ncbi:MAG: nicotinate phosphoribosyltransferase [Gammaproteobacteria bacterium]
MIIESLLDTDLYKLTMMQAVLHHFPAAEVEYRFNCRAHGERLAQHADRIREEITALCGLRFKSNELVYLRSLRYMKKDFVDILRIFQLQQDHIQVTTVGDKLEIIIRGPWLHTILFEVPVLAIISEVYGESRRTSDTQQTGESRLEAKITLIRNLRDSGRFRFTEFGTRRRFSRAWQRIMLARLSEALSGNLVGTSNVLLAKVLGLSPIGTMAHEFLQACQALGPRLADSQRFALETWAQEYRGDLGIALTDVIGIDAFLRDFDLYFCKLFDGVRHDSGDPFIWAEKVLEHYRRMRIDPLTKTLVFTDALDIPKAIQIFERFHRATRVSFGIGTHLSNDMGFVQPDMIIKMVRCNGQTVAKISDDPGKTLCTDDVYLAYLKKVFSA